MKHAQIVFAAIAMTLGGGSAAQALTDPTRPPLELMRMATRSAPAGPAAFAAPATSLQTILLSSARKGAVLNGQYVPLGGKFGDATLVRITATAVTLRSERGLEELRLYAPTAGAPAAAAPEPKPDKAARIP